MVFELEDVERSRQKNGLPDLSGCSASGTIGAVRCATVTSVAICVQTREETNREDEMRRLAEA